MRHNLLIFGIVNVFAYSLLLSGCATLSESILFAYDCKDLRKVSVSKDDKNSQFIRPSSNQLNAEYAARQCNSFEENE